MANEFKVKNGVITPTLFNTANSDLAISASGTGKLKLNSLNWPSTDGTADYVLKTDGAGNLRWAAQTGGGGGGGGSTASMVSQDFTGNGSQTAFTLTNTPTNINQVFVSINGVLQNRISAYTLSGAIITFSEAPSSGDTIQVSILISGILQGVATGGTLNQILTKASATNYDTAWSSSLSLTTVSTTGQISVSVATGTAPFVIGSTTRVNNLNVATAGTSDLTTSISGGLINQIPYQTAANTTAFLTAPAVTNSFLRWNGSAIVWTDLSSPPAIGGTAPSTGSFTTLSANSIITSTLAHGIAPLSITSRTPVANLRLSTNVLSVTTGATLTPDGTYDFYAVTALASATTFLTPSGTPANGQRLFIRIEDDGTARGLTWTATSGAYRAVGVTLPTTTVAGKVVYIGCVYNSQDIYWDVIAVAQLA